MARSLCKAQNIEVAQLLDRAEHRGACACASTRRGVQLLERRVRSGELLSPIRGVYVRKTAWENWGPIERERAKLRGLARLHPSWVFCGVSAGVLHGLWLGYDRLGPIYILTSRRSHARSAPPVVRCIRDGCPTEVVEGALATSLLETTCELLCSLSFQEGVAVADSALRKGLFARDELIKALDRGRRGRRGARTAMRAARFSDARSESGGESVSRAVMHELGFAPPELQVEFTDPLSGSRYRVDFLWRLADGGLIAGELDGFEKYLGLAEASGKGTVGAFIEERHREARLTAHGMRVVRFTYRDVLDRSRFAEMLDLYGVPRS